MNVIYYTQAYHSGAALYVLFLVRALARQGVALRLVCPSDYEYLDNLLVDNADLQVRATLPPLSESRGVARKMSQMLKQAVAGFRTVHASRREALVVHANFPGLHFFAAPLLIAFKLGGFRLVFNVHDVLPHRWLLPGPLRFFEWAMLWIVYLVADKLVVHHQEALDLLREKFGIRSRKVAIIPHGPFRLSSTPVPYEEKSNEIVALLFGALRENKGIHLAVRAVQKLRADGHPIKLHIAGHAYSSERSYWQRCKALIETSPSGISVVDRYLEDKEVKELIAGTHFFLLPYTEFHSQSGVAALALSNGRPIVATRAGGLSDVLLPGRTGILIEQPTVRSVEEALLRTISLGQHGLREMGQQAFKIYDTSFSWDAIAREYVELYRRLETRRGQGGR